jgi:hypothetical protein
MLKDILDSAIDYCRQDAFQAKVQDALLDPLLQYLTERLYPYILAVGAIFFLTFVFVSLVLILIVYSLFASKNHAAVPTVLSIVAAAATT